MKAAPLISTFLLALGLAGALHADAIVPADRHVAPATIELVQCEANAATSCDENANAAPGKTEGELQAPPANPKHQQPAAPATPVPEPQTFVMLVLGLLVLGVTSRRRASPEKFSD